jgi:hypothetical protein
LKDLPMPASGLHEGVAQARVILMCVILVCVIPV